jgi:hypothetical protein
MKFESILYRFQACFEFLKKLYILSSHLVENMMTFNITQPLTLKVSVDKSLTVKVIDLNSD